MSVNVWYVVVPWLAFAAGLVGLCVRLRGSSRAPRPFRPRRRTPRDRPDQAGRSADQDSDLRQFETTSTLASRRLDHMFEYCHGPGRAGDLAVHTAPVPTAPSVAAGHSDHQLGSVRMRRRPGCPRWSRASDLRRSALLGSVVRAAP